MTAEQHQSQARQEEAEQRAQTGTITDRHRRALAGPLEDVERGPAVESLQQKATVADIAHCQDARSVLEAVASLNGGTVHLNQTAELMVQAGLTRSKDSGSVRFNLYHIVTSRPDWERAEGQYWLWTAMPDPERPADE